MGGAVSFFLSCIHIKTVGGRKTARKGRKAVYKGIYDSGNLLVSQITGQGVCIIQKEQAAKLLLPKEKSEIEQLYIQFSEEKEEKKREKNGKKKQQIEQPLWRMWAKQFQTGIYVLQFSSCFQMIFSIEKKVVIYYNPKINRNI